jgi:adenylate kinase family enzyme
MCAYEKITRPLTEYYQRSGILVAIRASGTPEEILARSLCSLQELFARSGATQERA